MDIKRSGSQPSTKGPSEYFTGTVRIDPLFQANDPARAVGASVTFEPGASTAWHTPIRCLLFRETINNARTMLTNDRSKSCDRNRW